MTITNDTSEASLDSSCEILEDCLTNICNLPLVACLVVGFATVSVVGEIANCLFGNDCPCD